MPKVGIPTAHFLKYNIFTLEQCLGSNRQSLGGPYDVGHVAIAVGRGVLRLGPFKVNIACGALK